MNLITVLGPTASGKTGFAANLAKSLDTDIIIADSRQIYRGMDIGSGKDMADYIIDGKQVKAHLVDIVDAGEKYNVFRYQNDFFDVYKKLIADNKIPVLCGGTGLYLEAIVKNYGLVDVPCNQALRDELEKKSFEELKQMLSSMKTLHNNQDIDTKKRTIRALEIEFYIKDNPKIVPEYPKIDSLVFGVKYPRDIQRKKIHDRLYARMQEGMAEEMQTLINQGVYPEDLIYYGLEYKYVTLYVLGRMTKEEMLEKLEIEICQFSKRQMTWFRRMERTGIKINWIDYQMPMSEKVDFAKELIRRSLAK